jgi:hypothetical protein
MRTFVACARFQGCYNCARWQETHLSSVMPGFSSSMIDLNLPMYCFVTYSLLEEHGMGHSFRDMMK